MNTNQNIADYYDPLEDEEATLIITDIRFIVVDEPSFFRRMYNSIIEIFGDDDFLIGLFSISIIISLSFIIYLGLHLIDLIFDSGKVLPIII